MGKILWFLACAHLSTACLAGENDGPWRKTLADGSVVELLGVSTCPSGPKTWWKPDGTPLDKAPYDVPVVPGRLKKDTFLRELAIRHTTRDEAPKLFVRVDDDGFCFDRESLISRNKGVLTVIGREVACFPVGKSSCSVTCRGGVGSWLIEAASNPRRVHMRRGNAKGLLITEGKAMANGNVLVVVSAVLDGDPESRVVAIDRSGNLWPSAGSTGSAGDRHYQLIDEFKLKLDDIQEFQLRTRPQSSAEFTGVALFPATGPGG